MDKFSSFLNLLSIHRKIVSISIGALLILMVFATLKTKIATWISEPDVAPPTRLTPKIDLSKEINYPVCVFKQKECAYDSWKEKIDPVINCGDRNICD